MRNVTINVTTIERRTTITVNDLQPKITINATSTPVNRTINYNRNTAGLSAYQVAINNGFAGTEASWLLSLKGGIIVGYTHTGTAGLQNIILFTTHNVSPVRSITAYDSTGKEVSISSHINPTTFDVTIDSNIDLLNSKIHIN